MNQQRRKKKIAIIVVAIVVGFWLVVGAGVLGAWLSAQYASRNGQTSQTEAKDDGNLTVLEDEADLANTVKKVTPSVVSIRATKTTGNRYIQSESEGAGTGIIISSNGYILTNKHVIDGVTSVTVTTSDGAMYKKVDVIGTDPLNDIAFLKITDAKDLPVAELGNSSTVRVGQKVFTVGNSLGQYQNTVTSGIISGLGRPISAALDSYGTGAESLTDLLQTDAAINPGNSGGPLVNMAGQVIGINTAIVSDAQSIGFAIPINATKGLIKGLLKDGTIQKAFIGVSYLDITPDVRAEFNIDAAQGALIQPIDGNGSSVASGSPAEKAGIKDGDIITKIDDKVIGVHGGLSSIVAEYLPKEEIEVTVIRGDKTQTLKLTLGEYKR